MKKPLTSIVLLSALLTLAGCASVISEGVLKDLERNITIQAVQANPPEYLNRKVIWGGVILGVENLEDVTVIEVFQTKLDSTDAPTNETYEGAGWRFLIEVSGYLDTVVYKENKGITVAGIVKEVRRKKIGKMDYPYPVLKAIEMRLTSVEREYREMPAYYQPLYYPMSPYWPYYWPYYPWSPYPYPP